MLLKNWFTKRKRERRDTLLEAIDNQLQDNDPEGITDVFASMKDRGFEEREIKEMFAAVFEGELHRLNDRRVLSFDRDRYLEALKAIK